MKNVPRGLLIAILIGMVSGVVVGVFENFQYNHEQLIFQEGYSISIVTERLILNLENRFTLKL